MSYLKSSVFSLLVGMNLLTGCNSPSTDSVSEGGEAQTATTPVSSEPLELLDITVSILPQEYFVEKIGGDRVEVNVMVQPGESPATYEPKPQQLKDLSEAEAYVSIGVPFENAWMDKIQSANAQMLVIDSAQGIERLEMAAHHHHDEDHAEEAADHDHEEEHEHEEKHEHAEGTLDPHIWLSPQRVKIQAQNIYQGLVTIDPENEATYQANLTQFLGEIDQLDQQIKQNLVGVENREFIVFHPAWGYFAQDYDLEQVPIEIGGQEPSAAELGELIQQAKTENIQVIFAQPEFSTKSAETIATEIAGEVLFITPLAPNWSDNLLQVSQTFADVLNQNGGGN
ncbi:cation abc transporter substrate-binding protein [Leptolyngbya sp. Heron Island J]|uniref:metal ABC transporter solute-binding protein, Zn/Mn family n=1 Tax=Leptolyngbya sp. Heron Island J TaxID=1385935 RepID=UPI0003B96267|nr:zinc ABC transporter substrate-binding protein [Leptolyngbya sp. Heron Island J]ESA37722.1 cation abc transporter substrate-binding protein [Leptolyngbya sp. Heron Island J]